MTNLANAIAGNQAPPGNVVPQTSPISFATLPSMEAVNEHINYNSKHGASLNKQGAKALGTPFNMKTNQAVICEKELKDRASMMGWDKCTQNILKFTNRKGRQINLIAKYGQIDIGMLKTGYNLFNLTTGINSYKHAAQNNEQMWQCLYDSLTKEDKVMLFSYHEDYEILIHSEHYRLWPL